MVDLEYAVTGSLAAEQKVRFAPAALASVYVRDVRRAAQALGLRPAPSGGNKVLVAPGSEVAFERTWIGGSRTYAALSQVAADLLPSPGWAPSEAEALIEARTSSGARRSCGPPTGTCWSSAGYRWRGALPHHRRLQPGPQFLFSMSGETLEVGVDTGAPVGPYPHRFPFTGAIDRVEIVIRDEPGPGLRDEEHAGQVRGALRAE